jgi:transposase
MLLLTISFGGLLMMGHQARGESLFYYFKLEDQVPENHLLRLIDRHVNFEFIRAKLKDRYSDAGRPSIDPEVLLRMLLVGYLYGVTSERKLVEELRMHLAWRWFTGLGFNEEIPHHSTFSKNRHGRFQESNLFQELFEEIVTRCVAAGLVSGCAGAKTSTSPTTKHQIVRLAKENMRNSFAIRKTSRQKSVRS